MATRKESLAKLSGTANVIATPPFPRVPDEIKYSNPRLTAAWVSWEKAIDEWVKQKQVSGS